MIKFTDELIPINSQMQLILALVIKELVVYKNYENFFSENHLSEENAKPCQVIYLYNSHEKKLAKKHFVNF